MKKETSGTPALQHSGTPLPRLTSPSVIRSLLDSLGHRPNKGLGQNYLIDGNILGIIVDAAQISDGDRLLEIGPGLGALTQALLATGAPLTAIEKDPAMARHINHTFKGVVLLEDDVLNVNLSELFSGGMNKIVANLPYSVGSRFIVNALEANPLPEKMVFMVQKEVADRLTAQPGSKAYGPLAIWSQLNYEVKNIKNVSPNCFMPAPKVWSAVVRFEKRSAPLADVADYDRFKRLVKTTFTQRRKQIGSNLRKNLPEFFQGLEKAGIDPAMRPEQITIEQWVRLAD
ncbi:MAG: ribosomal RNA small subunit methyltransferase A [Kiritimatiellales bacterium]|nr:ribosomal RNA small subunit methyltransferase A [Kiritimatiellota bacterium]MBL7011740.1 ribosomal RNA small subunit methyltransferase A [Kiritimatiellales bacterium]